MRGIRAAGNEHGIAQVVKQLLGEKLRVVPKIVRVQRVRGGPVVTLLSIDTKKAIMKRKGELGDAAIWIEDDYTTREKEVEEWLMREAEKKRRGKNFQERLYEDMCEWSLVAVGREERKFGKVFSRDHIFTLSAVINNRLKKDRGKLYVAFVDFRAAFDTVDRDILMEKLEKGG